VQIRIALPKGRLLNETAKLTNASGWELSDYSEGARLYHLTSGRYPELAAKIFHEKDIPVQVAMGNYDLGICGLDWIQELMVKYPASGLIKVRNLGYGDLTLYLAANRQSAPPTLESIQASDKVTGIASEYPHLAESLALNLRLKHFNIFPVWGAAEIFPPENADLVLLPFRQEQKTGPVNLIPVARILDSQAYLIANKTSWETKDLSLILNILPAAFRQDAGSSPRPLQTTQWKYDQGKPGINITAAVEMPEESIRLALPDGHQQKHMVNVLNKAGIKISDYPSSSGNRRPEIDLPGVTVKVIRPQDMPLQVANGKFDMAVTGKDWVREHLYQFPSSPVVELADLKYGWVRIVAAIHNDLPANSTAELRQLAEENGWQIRVASEYIRIADKYARDNHLGTYRIVPTWGATEAFIPDDADILIENTETGGTLKRHNLKIIETLFESTACLIANTGALSTTKAAGIKSLADTLQKALE
jgi:ATP phosphoribosyltransferase